MFWARARVRIGIRVSVSVGVEGVKEPTAPGTLGLEKACQGDHSRVTTLLLLHLSCGPALVMGTSAPVTAAIRPGVRVESVTDPAAARTLAPEKALQGHHSRVLELPA